MKIIVTGSLGHISKPLTKQLVQEGHSVIVVSSNPNRQKDIEDLGAKAAIGTIEDVNFLTTTFTGADAVYCMEPPVNFFDHSLDITTYYNKLGNNYAQAIQQSKVKRVVHLSSIGAHTNKGNGMLILHYDVDTILKRLPSNVAITFLRPVSFYYNLFAFINSIKTQGVISTNYNATYKEPWVSPIDIADVVAEEIVKPFEGRTIRYIASDELTSNEIAGIIGEAIGNPDLKWVAISNEQQLNRMIAAGMNPQAAKDFVEMNATRQSGMLYEDYNCHRPASLGKVKLTDFAKEFARAYINKTSLIIKS